MTNYVLDSSALIRYIDGEPGGDRVKEVLKACVKRQAEVWISAVQWGEIAGTSANDWARPTKSGILSSLLPSEVRIVPATPNGRCVQLNSASITSSPMRTASLWSSRWIRRITCW